MRTFALGLVIACSVVGGVAHASDGIVVESYVGGRPANASQTIEPLLTELTAQGFVTGDSVGRLYEGKVSRPRANNLPADFAKQLKAGQQEYIRGNYAAAVALLQPLIDTAHDNSGAFARNQALRQTMMDGLIALALAQDRSGDVKTARLTFGEVARSFPDAQVAPATWGANAAKLFAEVQRELKSQSAGRLIIRAPANAEVYVNERLEQSARVLVSVVPGEYRVFVREGAKQSRTYRVQVGSAVEAKLDIDLDLDTAVHSSPGWTGFDYASASDRERFEAKHAATFANSIEERGIVVVGIDATRNLIYGALVNLSTGRDERRASIPLAASTAMKTQLARFLAGEPATKDLVVLVGAGASGDTARGTGDVYAPDTGSGGSTRWGGWPILSGAVALGLIGAGVYLYSIDETCSDGSTDPGCPDLRHTADSGNYTMVGGAVFVGVTVVLILTRPKSSAAKSAFIVPTRDGAMAGMSMSF